MFHVNRVKKVTQRKVPHKKSIPHRQHINLFTTASQSCAIETTKQQFVSELRPHYLALDDLFKSRIQAARKNNKKLLSIVTEGHNIKACLPSLLLTTLVAKKYGINTIATEMPEFILKLHLQNNTAALKKYQHNDEINIDDVVSLAKSLNMRLYPTDMPLSEWKYYDNSIELFAAREKHMADELQTLKQDAIFIVGAMHLLPLFKYYKESLNEQFDIVALNTAPINLSDRDIANDHRLKELFNFVLKNEQISQFIFNTDISRIDRKTVCDWVKFEVDQLELSLAQQEKSLNNPL